MSTSTRILFLGTNTAQGARLAVEQEFQIISDALASDPELELLYRFGVKAGELPDLIARQRPEIVHFSGHGMPTGELVFVGEHGDVEAVDIDPLTEVFRLLGGTVQCVVLSACFSSAQAERIAEHVPVVIGVARELDDDHALKFSAGFYQSFARGDDFARAFEFGRVQLNLAAADALSVVIYKAAQLPQPRSRRKRSVAIAGGVVGLVVLSVIAGVIKNNWPGRQPVPDEADASVETASDLQPTAEAKPPPPCTRVVEIDVGDERRSLTIVARNGEFQLRTRSLRLEVPCENAGPGFEVIARTEADARGWRVDLAADMSLRWDDAEHRCEVETLGFSATEVWIEQENGMRERAEPIPGAWEFWCGELLGQPATFVCTVSDKPMRYPIATVERRNPVEKPHAKPGSGNVRPPKPKNEVRSCGASVNAEVDGLLVARKHECSGDFVYTVNENREIMDGPLAGKSVSAGPCEGKTKCPKIY
jgi:hypothetical protein